jgi:DNA-binding beta-propeller fold protein YncE
LKQFAPKYLPSLLVSTLFFFLILPACTKDIGKLKSIEQVNNYPQAVGDIIINKCAVNGCHNSKSKDAAGGLNFETWDLLFEGGRNGAAVIAYRPDFSTLQYYTNTYSEYGSIQLSPRMPINENALSKEEVKTLFDWISKGAVNSQSEVKFSDKASNKKIYVANRGCDVVTIFDAKSKIAMRYIDVGETRGIESPVKIKVAPDNKHWYISFISGGFFLKYSVADNRLVGKVNLGVGNWLNFEISADSKTAYVVDASKNGKIATVDLTSMSYTYSNGYDYPQGIFFNKTQSHLYITSQFGNYIYKTAINDLSNPVKLTLDKSNTPNPNAGIDPYDITFSPDFTRYYVSCQGSNEVRVFQTDNDNLLTTISVGKFPQQLSFSKSTPYLFVSCGKDSLSAANQLSSIAVINYQTNSLVKTMYAGFESYGLVVDDDNKCVYVTNRNLSTNGPLPHHRSLCSGRNGYVTAIDLNTLNLIKNFRTEVSNDPYSIGMSN